MTKHFNDPIAIKNQKPKDKPVDGNNSPWDFRCPQYDERHSSFVQAGTNYGTGYNQPVGSTNQPKSKVSTLPYGPKVMRTSEKD